jgi:hypothetical protein
LAEQPKKPNTAHLKIAVALVLLPVIIVSGFLICIWVDTDTPSYFETGPIEIKVAPTKPFFLQGENINFTVTVINNQSYPIAQPSLEDARIERNGITVEGSSLHIDYGIEVPTYPADSNADFTWRWHEHKKDSQTIPHEIGTYTLTLRLKGNGYDTSGHCTFEIR